MVKDKISRDIEARIIRETQRSGARASEEGFVISTQYEPYKVVKRVYADGREEILYDQSEDR